MKSPWRSSFLLLMLLTSSLASSSSSSSSSSCSQSGNLSTRLLDHLLSNITSSSSSSSSSSSPLNLNNVVGVITFFDDAPNGTFNSIKRCILDDNVSAAAAAAVSSTSGSFSDNANSTACMLLACGRLTTISEAGSGSGAEEEQAKAASKDAEDPVKLSALLRGLLLDALEGRCSENKVLEVLPKEKKTGVPWQKSVAYGSGFAATIVIGSQFGGLLYPLRNHIAYKICLTYLIGLACGTLGAGGILHLMPACFGLHEPKVEDAGSHLNPGSHEEGTNHVYIATAMLVGAYLFYWIEIILRDMSAWKKGTLFKKPVPPSRTSRAPRTPADSRSQSRHTLHLEPPVINITRPPSEVFDDDLVPPSDYQHIDFNPVIDTFKAEARQEDIHSVRMSLHNNNNEIRKRKVSTRSFVSHASNLVVDDDDLTHEEGEIAPIAWILIMAKIFSTFIDGLTMGAAFTESIAIGIKIGIAIICEEYPHELGDIAVLLNSGMTFKRALLWNFIAASAVFPGVYVGILAGESSDANPWIFAVAAGMFVYISFVDMIPEVAALRDELVESGINYWLALFIQHLGLLSGFLLMFMMALYGDQIAG